MVQSRHYALAREAILRSLVAFTGITTADGAVTNDTLVCSALIGSNDYISNKAILILSGNARGEDSGASGFVAGTGTITVVAAFGARILAGTVFMVLNVSSVEIAVAAINAKIGTNADAAGTTTLFAWFANLLGVLALETTLGTHDTDIKALLATIAAYIDTEVAAIKTQTDRLAGATPGVGTATENWNAAEADIVSIGADNTRNKVHSLVVDISAITAASVITIRMYMEVNGVERKVYDQDFTAGTDPDGLWIVNGTVGIHEVLRVTAQSDTPGDDGRAIAYDYMLEAM